MIPILFRDLPRALEKEKDSSPTKTTVAGAWVASTDLIASFFRHGTSDCYYILIPSMDSMAQYRERLEQYPDKNRVVLVALENWGRLKKIPQLVIFSHLTRLFECAHIRNCVGNPSWVASTVTHALSLHVGLSYCLYTNLEHLYPHDSLVCTSSAAQMAVAGLLSATRQELDDASNGATAPIFQLPVIPLGVDEERFQVQDRARARKALGIPQDRVVFLYLGRFSSATKLDCNPLLMAFAEAFGDGRDNVLLILAGDDTQEQSAEHFRYFANQLGIGPRTEIRTNPTLSEKADLYAAADVFTSLSDNVQETFGLTILEAMACELPVIASDWSGYRDLVRNGETGYLIPTYWADCTEEMSQQALLRGDAGTHWRLAQSVAVDLPATVTAYREMANSPRLRQMMGSKGRETVLQRFTWRGVVRQYEELWTESAALAVASQRSTQQVHGVSSYPYFHVFRHFSAKILDDNTLVAITSSGLRYRNGEFRPTVLEQDRMGLKAWLHPALLSRLHSTPRVLGEFLEEATNGLGESRDVLLQHLLRLVKYGLARVSQDSARCIFRQSE